MANRDDAGRDERHKARMERKKAVVDGQMAKAREDRGVLVVTTGNGKGKSSAAFGMVCRALGHGMTVAVVQFIKGAYATGEAAFFQRFPDQVRFFTLGEGFTWETQDRARDIAAVQAAWERARGLLSDEDVDLVVLDELNIAFKLGYLDVASVLGDLAARPAKQHVIVTGRGAPQALIDAADTVTEMVSVKHAFQAGVKAQKGIEL